MVKSSDHISPQTGLVGGSTLNVRLSKGPSAVGTLAANNGSIVELDSVNLPGVYQLQLTAVDTGVLGDLWFACVGTAADNTDFCDQVQGTVFTDLQMVPSGANTGRVLVANNLQQGVGLNGFTFPMVSASTGELLPGLTVTAQRTLAGASFGSCTNVPAEVSAPSGIYSINLSASDLAADCTGLLFSAVGAQSLFIPVVPVQ